MSEPKKRFIAGAVCPACSAQDTIKMWDEDGTPLTTTRPLPSRRLATSVTAGAVASR